MRVNVPSGSISNGQLYEVAGTGTVTYATVTYNVGQRFTGTTATTYAIISGTPEVYQVLVSQGLTLEEFIRADEIVYPEHVKIQSVVLEEILQTSFSDKIAIHSITIEEQLEVSSQIIWIN